MTTIRAFIAINLPAETRLALAASAEELAALVPARSVRWVRPDQVHLTLRFLGQTPISRLNDIYEGLDRVAAGHQPFLLTLDRLGCFPNPRRPRVVWVGVKGPLEMADALKKAVDQMLRPLGWDPENRPFRAHLTLGRVKRDQQKVRLPWGKGVVPRPVPVDAVHLIESQLRPSGPVYTLRHTSHLGDDSAN